MSVEEAYAILGLSAGADAEAIKEAHRRLMVKLHPDHGGSDYLATKINRARDVLLHAADNGVMPLPASPGGLNAVEEGEALSGAQPLIINLLQFGGPAVAAHALLASSVLGRGRS